MTTDTALTPSEALRLHVGRADTAEDRAAILLKALNDQNMAPFIVHTAVAAEASAYASLALMQEMRAQRLGVTHIDAVGFPHGTGSQARTWR